MSLTEKLIERVRLQPILYDSLHKDYKDTRKKDKVWDDIAAYFGKTDGESVKKKWKNCRDCYSKYLRTHSDVGFDRYKTWPWANQMEFVKPFICSAKKHPIEITETEVDEDVNLSQRAKRSKNNNNDPSRVTATDKLTEVDDEDVILTQKTKRSKNNEKYPPPATDKESAVTKVISFLENRNKEDEIDLMFKAYAQTMKKFSKMRQAEMKFKLSKLFFKAEIEEINELDDQNSHSDSVFQRSLSSLKCSPEPEPESIYSSTQHLKETTEFEEYIISDGGNT